MKRFLALLGFFSFFAACSGASSSGVGGNGNADGGTANDGGATSNNDAAAADSGTGTTDSGTKNDGGADAGPACTPATGTTDDTTSECDLVQVSILTNGASSTVSLVGRVGASGTAQPTAACTLIDSIDVVSGNSTIQTIAGNGTNVSIAGNAGAWTSAAASPALAALCSVDTGRFDGIGLVVHGRMDGGTFTSKCGNNTFDTGWPPRVVITCSTGLDHPPEYVNGVVQLLGASAIDEVNFTVPPAPTVTSVDASIHVIPGISGFEAPPPMQPFDTTGWAANVASATQPDGSTAVNVSLMNQNDVLGTELCPAPTTGAPTVLPPVFIARLTGATSAGSFSSEIYVDSCMRTSF